MQLPNQRALKEEETSSSPAPEEEASEALEIVDSEEDFEIFDQPPALDSPRAAFSPLPPAQVSSSQGPSNVPKGMVLQRKKKTSLFENKPPTPLPIHNSSPKQDDKKRKRDKKGKDVAKEGEVVPSKELKPQKRAKMAKRVHKRPSTEGAVMERGPKRRLRIQIWNPPLELDGAPLPLDSSIRDFQRGKAGYVANALEQPLLLP